jgi:hypothetical protein
LTQLLPLWCFDLVEDQRRIMGAVGAAGLLPFLKMDRSAPGNRLQPPSSAFRPVWQATAAILPRQVDLSIAVDVREYVLAT